MTSEGKGICGKVLKCVCVHVQGSAPAEGAGELSLGRGGDPAAGHPAAVQPHQARGQRQGQVSTSCYPPSPRLLPHPHGTRLKHFKMYLDDF